MQIALISVTAEFISIGLRIISAGLKKEGHNVSMIFLGKDNNRGLDQKELNSLKNFLKGYDLVGFSFTSNYFDLARTITIEFKRDIHTKIIWGGIHPTICPKECLEYADYVCVGEGEILMKELTSRMERNQEFKDLHNLGYKHDGRSIINPVNPLIDDLNSLPISDLDESSHYTIERGGVISLKNNPNYERYVSNQYTIMASRGCPHNCTYCANDFFKNQYPGQRYVRRRSIEKIIEELQQVKTRMPFVKEINFVDDYFLGNPPKAEVEEFIAIYKKEISLPFYVLGFSPGQCKEEFISLLVDAGMKGVRMGIQSGSKDILSLFSRKQLTVEKILESARVFNKYSKEIQIDYDFILDLPWATEEDEKKTFDLILSLPKPFNLIFYSFVPFPGTSLFEKAKQEGLLDKYKNKNYGEIQNSYFNSLIYLFEFRFPYFILRLLSNENVYKSKIYKPCYLFLKSTTRYLKFSYIVFYLYPWLLLTGKHQISKYEIRRGIDNLKKVMGFR